MCCRAVKWIFFWEAACSYSLLPFIQFCTLGQRCVCKYCVDLFTFTLNLISIFLSSQDLHLRASTVYCQFKLVLFSALLQTHPRLSLALLLLPCSQFITISHILPLTKHKISCNDCSSKGAFTRPNFVQHVIFFTWVFLCPQQQTYKNTRLTNGY